MPLRRAVLIVRCAGPATSLVRICAQAAADLQLEKGEVQMLAPTPALASRIRSLVEHFEHKRERARRNLAQASGREAAAKAAVSLTQLNRAFGDQLSSLPVDAQDRDALHAVEKSAGEVAHGYVRLAAASTPAAWAKARSAVLGREQQLMTTVESLNRLRIYPARQ
jgi:hypothetical protein